MVNFSSGYYCPYTEIMRGGTVIYFCSDEALRSYIENEVLTLGEALDYLGISKKAFNLLEKQGRVTPFKNKIEPIFLKSDLKKVKQQMTQKPTMCEK